MLLNINMFVYCGSVSAALSVKSTNGTYASTNPNWYVSMVSAKISNKVGPYLLASSDNDGYQKELHCTGTIRCPYR